MEITYSTSQGASLNFYFYFDNIWTQISIVRCVSLTLFIAEEKKNSWPEPLQQGWVYLSSPPEGIVHGSREGMTAGKRESSSNCICSQEGERWMCSPCLLLCIQFSSSACGKVSPTLRMNFLYNFLFKIFPEWRAEKIPQSVRALALQAWGPTLESLTTLLFFRMGMTAYSNNPGTVGRRQTDSVSSLASLAKVKQWACHSLRDPV